MAYTKQQWLDDSTSSPYGPISAARLTHIESGLDAVANSAGIVTDAAGATLGYSVTANALTDATYGAAIQFGNTHGSFGGAGFYAPVVHYQTYGTNNGVNAVVPGSTQGFIGLVRYFGPTSTDSAEGGSYGVYVKNTGTGFTQSQQTTGWEADAQVEGSNHATGYVNALAGRITLTDTAIVDDAHVVYAGLLGKAAGATVTNYTAFFENPNNSGIATNSWTLRGVNDLRVGGFEGIGPYYADISQAASFGFKSWNFDPSITTTGTAPTAGVVYAQAVPYRKGQIVTYTDWYVVTAGSGTAPTHIYTGICDSTGKMLAQSGDDRANTTWTTASTIGRSALSGAYTILTSGLYYHVFLQVGSWSVTQHTMNRVSGTFAFPNGSFSTATGTTAAQTALPANNSTLAGGIGQANTPLRYFTGSE